MSITSKTYSFTNDPAVPGPAPIPPSSVVTEANRVTAECATLAPEYAAPHPPGNLPLALVKLGATAHRLRLLAQAFGGPAEAEAVAAAAEAAAKLEETWTAAIEAPPAPPKAVPVEDAPVEDLGIHTPGRPKIGEIVHLDAETGVCRPAFVMEIKAGVVREGDPAPSPRDPLLRVADVADVTRPVLAKYDPAPKLDPQPGFHPPVKTWHRPAECKR